MERSIYTDLAKEARELCPDIPGISEETLQQDGVEISRITVETQQAARDLGKPMGHYITIEAEGLAQRDNDAFAAASKALSGELKRLLADIGEYGEVLITGLGNRAITPDSLGPRVVEHTFVTRHITTHMADSLIRQIRPVAAMAPGVLGVTGVETLEVVRGLVERTTPKAIIAIDSLASRRAARISTAIQISDTGIQPGSGVGNARLGLNQQELHVPVIAIGVPTVVMASTISQDTIRLIADETGLHQNEERWLDLAEKVVKENFGPLIVTPKEIDMIVQDMARVLSDGINFALHEAYYEDIKELLS